jgi:GNAT superfamily N-acetyltransferase
MSWRPALRRDITGVLALVLHEEPLCVSFTARLKEQAKGCTLFVNAEEDGEVRECVLFSSYGLLLPVLPGSHEGEGLAKILRGLRPAVHSIMGIGSWVQKAEALIPVDPTTKVDYHLMTLSRRDYTPRRFPMQGLRAVKATVTDAEALFPLQRSYEQEEVVINPFLFNDAQCMRLLKKSLREELIYFVEKGGKPVAKAGTNARGFAVDQIGGVFTVVEERGKGYATTVMETLLDAIFMEKEGACLFVKKHNNTAISLYERLGFQTVSDYVISYYGL